jgi:hypothetical protein
MTPEELARNRAAEETRKALDELFVTVAVAAVRFSPLLGVAGCIVKLGTDDQFQEVTWGDALWALLVATSMGLVIAAVIWLVARARILAGKNALIERYTVEERAIRAQQEQIEQQRKQAEAEQVRKAEERYRERARLLEQLSVVCREKLASIRQYLEGCSRSWWQTEPERIITDSFVVVGFILASNRDCIELVLKESIPAAELPGCDQPDKRGIAYTRLDYSFEIPGKLHYPDGRTGLVLNWYCGDRGTIDECAEILTLQNCFSNRHIIPMIP